MNGIEHDLTYWKDMASLLMLERDQLKQRLAVLLEATEKIRAFKCTAVVDYWSIPNEDMDEFFKAVNELKCEVMDDEGTGTGRVRISILEMENDQLRRELDEAVVGLVEPLVAALDKIAEIIEVAFDNRTSTTLARLRQYKLARAKQELEDE